MTAVLQADVLAVDPGESVAGEVLVRNEGATAVEVTLAIVGPARPYSWLAAEHVSVDARSDRAVRFGFHLPRASVPAAGPLPFTVTATPAGSTGAVGEAVTAAGTVDVRPFALVSVTLSEPMPGKGGDRAREVTVTNRGNAAAPTVLRGEADGAYVRIDPPRVVAPSGDKVTARVEVTPVSGAARGGAATLPFRVVAEPEAGTVASVDGEVRLARVAPRRPLVVVLPIVAVLALVAAAVAVGSSDGRSGSPPTTEAAAGPPLDECPARGHTDAYGVRGLEPSEIATLPDTYTFLRVRDDGCSPVRFNPCEPVHYVQNAADAPPFVVENVREAFRRLSRATGITFVDDGLTDETVRTGPYVPERYGQRWAPILIVWEHFPPEQTGGRSQILGNTVVMREQGVVVSARLRFNVDAYNDEFTKAPIEAGFGPPAGSGEGPIGRQNITWGRIILHELAHVAGLGHTSDTASLMYPDAAQHTTRPADFARPDLQGLRHLGREAGCLQTPPLPAG